MKKTFATLTIIIFLSLAIWFFFYIMTPEAPLTSLETFLVVTVKGDIAIVGITDSVAFLVNYFDPAVEMYRKSSFPSNHRLHNYLLFHNNTEPYYPPYFILRELLLRCVFTPARKAVRAYH